MEHSDFDKVRASVKQQCGNKVVIQLEKGRTKVDIQEGIIQEAYPSVFTILTDDTEEKPSQLLSFSYTDIITKEIIRPRNRTVWSGFLLLRREK